MHKRIYYLILALICSTITALCVIITLIHFNATALKICLTTICATAGASASWVGVYWPKSNPQSKTNTKNT